MHIDLMEKNNSHVTRSYLFVFHIVSLVSGNQVSHRSKF